MDHNQNKGEAQLVERFPELPALAKAPWAWTPDLLKAGVVTGALNTLFAEALMQGELDFLDQRTVNVHVADAGIEFSVRKDGGMLRVAPPTAEPDLRIEGIAYTFLLLVSREEDADTLFFRRHLKTSGDTELGLFVKNFLAGLEADKLPLHRVLDPLLHGGLRIAERTERLRRVFSSLVQSMRPPPLRMQVRAAGTVSNRIS